MFDVRPVPANAPQPWLPLQALSLRYAEAPRTARAGDAVDIIVEAVANGANATQMPEFQLPVGDGAQVFAEPAQTDETFDNGRPQVKVTRKFSIVPSRAGALRIPGPRIAWWDVRAAAARTASLPDLQMQVAAGAQGADAAPASSGVAGADAPAGGARLADMQGGARIWALVAAAFALLWLATLVWALQRGAHPSAQRQDVQPARGTTPSPGAGLRDLKRALDGGDLGDVADVLCAMADPPAADLDAVYARLDEAAQRDAIAQLQRARWGDGDAPAARAGLRTAFANGPRWRKTAAAATEPLPPLYPQG